jgi:hypothetical protein
MRGTKAKRLRKAGLKPGRAERPPLTEQEANEIRLRQLEAKAAPR